MDHIVLAFFIALTNNFDNIGARIAYSIRGISISTPVNLWISVITFVISYLAAFSGKAVSGSLGTRVSSLIAMVLLTAIGSWMILEPYIKKLRENRSKRTQNIGDILLSPEIADKDQSKHIDFKEATLLGIALSLNNIGGGLSAGILGVDALLVGFLSAVISFVALWAGNYISAFFIRMNIAQKATIVAGLILIAIGIEQIL
ncbi:MAG: manganese efflux pump [Syntrophobacteraceae bacterium]|nr:manganese efflux pump [Syntrophobacteraceae bacterium]